MLIRIDEIILPFQTNPAILQNKIVEILDLPLSSKFSYEIVKRAIDSRNKRQINFVYSVEVKIDHEEKIISKIEKNDLKKFRSHRLRLQEEYSYEIPKCKKQKQRPIIVGSGPAGLFAALILAKAGLNPLIIERGKKVDDRLKDIKKMQDSGKLNPNSNVQFGEGGAGTFSDGKLSTLITNHRIKYIFQEMVKAGAPEDILWDAKPHIGTDNLQGMVKNLREKIIKLGGEFRFESIMTDIIFKNNKISAIMLNDEEKIPAKDVILAIGHSARDTYEKLYERGLKMAAKPFSMGIRIEHKREMIDRSQYGDFYNEKKLGAARYKLVAHVPDGRSVYSFCMCPGGYVMASSSEENRLTINGMSEYARDNENSNSALLVNVFPEDFDNDSPLAGVEFQRHWEAKAFELGGGGYKAPVQLLGDFLQNKKSEKLGAVKPSYRPGFTLVNLRDCLPNFIYENLKKALPQFENKIKGFTKHDAVLTALESRSSAPLKILRDEESFESSVAGLYPTGEGAGYAGGIVSSAVDGILVAEEILKKYL